MTDQVRKAVREELINLKHQVEEIKGLTSRDTQDRIISLVEGRLEHLDTPHCFREEVSD